MIELTYKDEANDPVIGGQPVVGSSVLWGFVESSARVQIDIEHADGTTTPVHGDNVAVDQYGYFCVRLDEALAEGDIVAIRTIDFCGNVKNVEVPVTAQLSEGAIAEVLGANITGKYGERSDEKIGHRFATPIDLEALALSENKSIELPILAYKGIEIGKLTVTLNENGMLDLSYVITATDYIPAGAQARLSTYAKKPNIEMLVLGEHKAVVQDLSAAAEGTLGTIDISGYYDEEGVLEGVVWFYAEFDIDMDEESFVNRGGRGVNFYRWLSEDKQTETLLNAIYSETAAYEENMKYFKLYQMFQNT